MSLIWVSSFAGLPGKNFLFPDWTNNSTFHDVTPLTLTGLNADNLPIAQSVIANAHLEITLRHEMLDTVLGTPMGTTPASSTGVVASLTSSRYVLKQTATIRNISGAAIFGVQFFQFLHGLQSQRGVYDHRLYAGPLSEFRYDVTQAGVDAWAVGAGSSSAGLEDFIGFHASVAPSAFEIGYYGIEGNGIDVHSIGKPSDGVHLSVEDNWQNPHSMFGQVDAIGQMLGGPIVAVIAAFGSAVASLVTSSLLLTPALFFVSRANSGSANEADEEIESIPAN